MGYIQRLLNYRTPDGDWFRSTGGRFSNTKIWYLTHNVHKLVIKIAWNKLNLTITFKLKQLEIWNKDTKTSCKLLKYIISGLMIDWKYITSRIYNQINVKTKIYLNFMSKLNEKLWEVRFCNKKPKFCKFMDYNLSSFESDQPSVMNVRSI